MKWLEDKMEKLAGAVAAEAEQTRREVAAAADGTQRALRVHGSLARALRPGVIYAGTRPLVGWSVRSGAGGPVDVDLYDGNNPGAVDDSRLIASFTVPDGGSTTAAFTGINFGEGLYAVITGEGTFRGTLLIGAGA